MIEVGKYYTAYPEFARLEGVQSRPDNTREPIRKKRMFRPLHLRIAPARYPGILQRYPGIVSTG